MAAYIFRNRYSYRWTRIKFSPWMDKIHSCFVGFALAALGGYSSQAHMLKVKPFDNSYKNARKSYDEDEK